MTPVRTLLVIALLAAAGCDGQTPTQPKPLTQPGLPGPPGPTSASNGASFEVTGMVTNEGGTPMAGAVVTMAHYSGGVEVHLLRWPTVSTDASGNYRIGFTATPLGNGFVARAQVVADGYEEYWRSLRADGRTTYVENVRLSRITRITAGDSIVLSVGPNMGDCRGWVAAVCAVVRITIPKAGRLTVEAVSDDTMTERPPLEVCCESGNEVYGHPVTVTVVPGPELMLFIGLGQGVSTARSFKVKTSFEAF
jgi:hypothetical protein